MAQSILEAFDEWYNGLRVYARTGCPSRATINAALVVLERLKEEYNLDLDSHRVPGQSQIQGAVGALAAQVLARFGETRPFVSQAPSSNRRGPGEIARMLAVLDAFQEYLVLKVQEWHARQSPKAVILD
jgi:hypothetical protein